MTFKETLLQLFKTDARLLDAEGELMGNKIQDLADKTDEKLIELLLDNPATRANFFIKIKEVYVFKTSDFKFYIDENKIDNSYTQYENRIGLTSKGKFLKDSNDVVLDFPYKDCILEGGQSTEEGTDTYFEWDEKNQHYTEKQAKRKEIFFNSVLAKDEIDRLLEPKAFANAKRYTSNGIEFPSGGVPEGRGSFLNRDENGTIKDNLIIKGNNLLALHTLKKEFAGKVKLIYIDPPYNTGNDSFAYNDNFNHSTWLTFMRNRLLVARELLRADGLICLQCDDNENAYLKILLDEVFENGFLNNVAVKMSEASGVKMNHSKNRFPKIKEYILIYKMSNFKEFVTIDKYQQEEWDEENNIFIENFSIDDRNNLIDLELKEHNNQNDIDTANEILKNTVKISLTKKLKELNFKSELEKNEWLSENSYRIIKTAGSSSLAILVKNLKEIPKQSIAAAVSKNGILFFYITDFNKETKQPRLQVIFADSNIFKNPCDFWQDIKTTGAIADEGGVKLSNGKKPEKIINRLITMTLNENDIILDYHLGSGTTAAVAHKMKRQYIGIEQMECQINLSSTRLQNVINGDKTGISKQVNWQGGGSFIYLELAKNNQNAIDQIQNCKSNDELVLFFDTMCKKYFLHYNVKIKQFKEEISKEENFKKLSLEKQKELFIKMLDLNQLYVNVADMEDKKHNLTAYDIAITNDFYQI